MPRGAGGKRRRLHGQLHQHGWNLQLEVPKLEGRMYSSLTEVTDSRAQDVVFNSVPVSPTRIENEDVFDNEFRMRIEARLDLGRNGSRGDETAINSPRNLTRTNSREDFSPWLTAASRQPHPFFAGRSSEVNQPSVFWLDLNEAQGSMDATVLTENVTNTEHLPQIVTDSQVHRPIKTEVLHQRRMDGEAEQVITEAVPHLPKSKDRLVLLN